jgi:hypothetical protein
MMSIMTVASSSRLIRATALSLPPAGAVFQPARSTQVTVSSRILNPESEIILFFDDCI